jgi:hypothetical protein
VEPEAITIVLVAAVAELEAVTVIRVAAAVAGILSGVAL